MRKSKIRNWLIGTGIILALVIVSGYFIMNFAVNKVLNAIGGASITDMMIPEESANPNVSSTPAKSNPVDSQASPSPSPMGSPQSSSRIVVPIGTLNPLSTPSISSQTPPSVQGVTTNPGDTSPKYEGEVTQEKAANAENQISFSDKAKISTILLKKLSADDISLIVKLSSGGMSVDEKREAKKIILQKLSEDEYNSLISIAAKLGLSQGKSYEDSLKESQKESPKP